MNIAEGNTHKMHTFYNSIENTYTFNDIMYKTTYLHIAKLYWSTKQLPGNYIDSMYIVIKALWGMLDIQ